MLRAAATDVGRLYKRQLVDLLDVREGHTVLDAGCGPGTDLPTLAERVGATGTVVGVDRDPAMLAQARERTRELPRVEIREGDVLDLPVDRGTVDRRTTRRSWRRRPRDSQRTAAVSSRGSCSGEAYPTAGCGR